MSFYQDRSVGHLPPPGLSDKLRLYHVDMNPYGHRVLLILEAKKAKYEVYKLDPLRLPEWFKVKNPRCNCTEPSTLRSSPKQLVLNKLLDFLFSILSGTNYFSGHRPGMLDYMIWPWVERLYLLRCVSEQKFDSKRGLFPNFADWADQMQLDEVVKKHAVSPQEYFDYYRNARTHSMGYYI
ncbi:uncharacterized protein LOC113505714 [Trichoplusia ni]|uniref:Uncharacterized protein LOC113505714 n=1 Tax=Trichoplusia ni TaxID=7111 RepID=A0A7E5WU07_TRINI|nr:uncharacterized protein LOC113505714 [Trichoplusia ni]